MKVANKHLFFNFIKFYCLFSESNLDLLHIINNFYLQRTKKLKVSFILEGNS